MVGRRGQPPAMTTQSKASYFLRNLSRLTTLGSLDAALVSALAADGLAGAFGSASP